MDILRWFRRRWSDQPDAEDAPIDPLPWEDRINQVRGIVDAFDAARRTGDTTAADEAPPQDSPPADPEA